MSNPSKTKTVLVLVGLMMLSGFLIPAAYLRYMEKQEFRPPFERRLHKNIQLLADDGEIVSLSRFEGKLWLAYATSSQTGHENLLIHQKVEDLRAQFPQQKIMTCIFVVNLGPEDASELAAYRAAHSAQLSEDDLLVAAQVPVVQKYLKNEFRFGLLPYLKKGIWEYDRDLIVVDTKNHLRGHFDFLRARQVDSNGEAERALDAHLSKTLSYLIANPEEESSFIRN